MDNGLSSEQTIIRYLGKLIELSGDLFALIQVRTPGNSLKFKDDPQAVEWLAGCGRMLTSVGASIHDGQFIKAASSLSIFISAFKSYLEKPNREALDYFSYPGCAGLLIDPEIAIERIARLRDELLNGGSPSRTH